MTDPDYDDDFTDATDDDAILPFNPVDECVYLVPAEKFIYRHRGKWAIDTPVTIKGLRAHLLHAGCGKDTLRVFFKEELWRNVHGVDLIPNAGDLAEDPQHPGRVYINTWVPPTLVPAANPYPTIERVLQHLTDQDPGGVLWLKHWIAAKLQNPEFVPKLAVVFSTQPGAGKGCLAATIRACLGEENTASVTRGALESRFNQRWAGKLFVLADEVVSADHQTRGNLSEQLKVWIDAADIEIEGKGTNQLSRKSRLAWMFASNSFSPVHVEAGDRRYTVFSNHATLDPEYVRALNACFEADRTTPTPEYRAEQAGFFYDLLNLRVDRGLIARPYLNAHRDALIEASRPNHELFVDEVNEGGLEDLLDGVLKSDFRLESTRSEWDWGDEGIASPILYRCYQEHCARTGGGALRHNRFGVAIGKHWPKVRPTIRGRQVRGFKVPRGERRPTSTPPRLVSVVAPGSSST